MSTGDLMLLLDICGASFVRSDIFHDRPESPAIIASEYARSRCSQKPPSQTTARNRLSNFAAGPTEEVPKPLPDKEIVFFSSSSPFSPNATHPIFTPSHYLPPS